MCWRTWVVGRRRGGGHPRAGASLRPYQACRLRRARTVQSQPAQRRRDDLGVPKAWIVARRIAKIDPYLRVTVFDGGVTPANIDTFLDGLDLLVEECDDLAVKYDI